MWYIILLLILLEDFTIFHIVVCLDFQKQNQGVVVDVISSELRKERPQALNTVELLKVASSGLGLSPTQTMSTAEYLYTRVHYFYFPITFLKVSFK